MAITTLTMMAAPYTGGRKDYILGTIAGLIIGALVLPILKNAQPDLYESIWSLIIPFFFIAVPAGLIVASFIAKKIAIVWQLAKFLVIGVMNTLVDIGVLAFISLIVTTEFHSFSSENTWFTALSLTVTYYSFYKALSFIIANINSYFWNKYWTFGADNQSKVRTEFFQFFLVSLVGFAINVIAASLVFTSLAEAGHFNLGQTGLIGAAFGSALGLIWNFVGYKFLVFKK